MGSHVPVAGYSYRSTVRAHTGVKDVDDWIHRSSIAGHLSPAQRHDGKMLMLPASAADRSFVKRQMVSGFSWATGIVPRRDYKVFGLAPATKAFRHHDSRQAIVDAFAFADRQFPTEPITVGQVSRMVRYTPQYSPIGTALSGRHGCISQQLPQRGRRPWRRALRSTAEVIPAS